MLKLCVCVIVCEVRVADRLYVVYINGRDSFNSKVRLVL